MFYKKRIETLETLTELYGDRIKTAQEQTKKTQYEVDGLEDIVSEQAQRIAKQAERIESLEKLIEELKTAQANALAEQRKILEDIRTGVHKEAEAARTSLTQTINELIFGEQNG